MSTFRNTNYVEQSPDSPNERWGAGSTQASRDFDLFNGSYLSRMQAAYDFLGYATVVDTGEMGENNQPVYYIHRVVPMALPALPNTLVLPASKGDLPAGAYPPDLRNRLYAMGISRTQPLGPPTGINSLATPAGTAASEYQRARLTVEFSTVPYRIFDDATLLLNGGAYGEYPDEGTALADQGWASTRYITRHIEPFCRLIKVPYGLMATLTNANPANCKLTKTAVPLREGGANVEYTWMRVPLEGPVPGVNFSKLSAAEYTINNATFDDFPANTLLFDSFSTRQYQGAFGELLADVTFKMIFLPHSCTGNSQMPGRPPAGTPLGWNYVADLDSVGRWDYYAVRSAGNANGKLVLFDPPYQTSDFSTLFRPGSFT